jgi:hypothetical protein
VSIFLDRSRRGGAHLEWKIRLFAAGATLGVSGMYLEEKWLTGGGIVVLLVGALLRFVPGGAAADEDGEQEDDGGSGPK